MRLLAAFLVLTAFIALYVVWLRPWLREKDWAWSVWLFAAIEPFERRVFNKSESILWARFLKLVGLGVPLAQAIGAVDITPYMAIIPDGWGPYLLLLIFVAGQIGEMLRKDTTKPLEVVAMPESLAKDMVEEKIDAANAEGKAVAVEVAAVEAAKV